VVPPRLGLLAEKSLYQRSPLVSRYGTETYIPSVPVLISSPVIVRVPATPTWPGSE